MPALCEPALSKALPASRLPARVPVPSARARFSWAIRFTPTTQLLRRTIPPPQFVIVQPAKAVDTPPEAKSEPLLIELQGNRYVRFGGKQQSAERGTATPPDYAEGRRTQFPKNHPTSQRKLNSRRSADLSRRSSRAGARIRHRGQHYLRQRRLLANRPLDEKHPTLLTRHPATVQANHDNGVKFTLPSAPNEVITRP